MQQRFLIISGMHRSNTSLLAQLLDSAGIRFGTRLVGANDSNPFGHFEDLEVVGFHESVLRRNGASWRPWRHRSYRVPADEDAAIRNHIAECTRGSGLWGFKVPHATLLLDYWRTYEGASFLFIFRRPEEVIYSALRRIGSQVYYKPYFALNIYRTYCIYNENILHFCRRFGSISFLVDNRQLLASPRSVIGDMGKHLDLAIDENEVDATLIKSSIKGMQHRALARHYARALARGRRAAAVYAALQNYLAVQAGVAAAA